MRRVYHLRIIAEGHHITMPQIAQVMATAPMLPWAGQTVACAAGDGKVTIEFAFAALEQGPDPASFPATDPCDPAA